MLRLQNKKLAPHTHKNRANFLIEAEQQTIISKDEIVTQSIVSAIVYYSGIDILSTCN